jgi:hypothetical protein
MFLREMAEVFLKPESIREASSGSPHLLSQESQRRVFGSTAASNVTQYKQHKSSNLYRSNADFKLFQNAKS